MDNSNEPLISLSYLNGTGFTFNVDDYMKIRQEYRLIGKFIGASSSRGHDPAAFALPASFSEYETKLLLEKRLARLMNKSKSMSETPSEEITRTYNEFIEQRKKDQEVFSKETYLNNSRKHIGRIVAGKKRKLAEAHKCSPKDIEISEEEIMKELEENYKFNVNDTLEDVPYEYPFPHTASEIKEVDVPDEFKYKVFKDLWEKGKYVTCGASFGGDFLVYPGDPLLYHASHIIITIENGCLSPLEIVGKARLAVNVSKVCTFAYAGVEDTVLYQNFHWTNEKR